MNNVFYLVQGNNLVLTVDGVTHTVSRGSNKNFDAIIEAIEAGDYAAAIELANPARAIETFYSSTGNTELKVLGNQVQLNGAPLPSALEERLLDMYDERLPLKPLVNFLERVQRNPSAASRRELYLFLEGNSLPLTPDGCFMAYKSVYRWDPNSKYTVDDSGRQFAPGDYRSIATNHAGLPTRYRVGDVVSMDRGAVDDDRERTCSFGLHFASLDYAQSWTSWDALLLLEIDPADVVSIPKDYDNQKGRACKFRVHSVYAESNRANAPEVEEAFQSPVFDTGTSGPDFDPGEYADERWVVYNQATGAIRGEYATRDEARDGKYDWQRLDPSQASNIKIWDCLLEQPSH